MGAIANNPLILADILPLCRIGANLTSRFLINLRQVSQSHANAGAESFPQFSAPGFRVPVTIDRVIGNMGEFLEFAKHHEDENAEPNAESFLGAGGSGGDYGGADAPQSYIVDTRVVEEVL